MKRITNARSLSVNTGEMNNQINHTGMAARTRSQRLNRGLTLLVVGAVALLLAGCADDSTGGNSVTVPAKPDAPTVTATSDTVLVISWSALSGATQYRLFRSATEDGTYERIAADESIATISYTNSGLTIGTTYYYQVAACGSSADSSCSAQSAAASGITRTLPAPAAPTVTATSDTELAISWSAVSGATPYRLYRSATEDGAYERIAADESVIDITYTDSGLTMGTTYYYRLAACGGNTDASCSAQSAAASGITRALPAPTTLSVVTASDTVLDISWSEVSGATQYRLFRSATEDGTYERIAADESIATISYTNSGLTMATTYYYRVAACSGNTDASCSAQSAVASGITMIPSVPTALTVTATSDIALTISWGAVSGATQYRLYRSATEDGTYTLFTTSITRRINSGLTAATTYYYQVAACGSSASISCSVRSATASGITRALPTPVAPTIATASGTVLDISWSMVSGATQYRLFRSATEDGMYTRISSGTPIIAITYTNSGLTAGTTYYYRVAACGSSADSSCSAQSVAASGITNPPIPAAPTVTATSDTKLTISWSEVSGATQYRIFRSATIAGTYTRIAPSTPITAISYTNTGLAVGTTYYYRLAACGSSANSSCSMQSTETSISTRPLPTLPKPRVSRSSGSAVVLFISWNGLPGATQYRLYRSATEDGIYTQIVAINTINTTNYNNSGLTAATTYYYRVAACNGAADASCSAQSLATRESTPLPFTPAMPTLMASSSTALLISWRAASGATRYRLERSAAETGTYTDIATITSGISYVDTGLTPETAYYYRLTACASNAVGICSITPSSVASATTPAALTTVSGAFASVVYTSNTIGSFNLAGTGQPNITHSLVVISNRLYMMANTTGLSFNAPYLYRLPGDSSKAVIAGAVGPSSGHEFNPQGMAAIGNTVYMVGSGKLYSMEIDPNTNRLAAFATIVGTLQHGTSPSEVENEPRGLAAIGNTLYLVGGSTPALYTVSITNGSLLKVGDLKAGATFLPSDRLTSAMTANNGTIYTALKSNADIDKAELYSINPADAQATLIGDITIGGASPEKMPTGLAVWGERLYLLGDGGDNLYR